MNLFGCYEILVNELLLSSYVTVKYFICFDVICTFAGTWQFPHCYSNECWY